MLIITYAAVDEAEMETHHATVVHVDAGNRAIEVSSSPIGFRQPLDVGDGARP